MRGTRRQSNYTKSAVTAVFLAGLCTLCYTPLMILYVDETENEEYFIVAGLLTNNEADVDSAYRRFKNKANNSFLSVKEKQRVFTEFKSTILDRHFQKIKVRMLREISDFDNSIIYSCFIKKIGTFQQSAKEDAYILLLSKIAASLNEKTDIVFDEFRKSDFERKIITAISQYSNVHSVISKDSRLVPGLQFADNICSVLRLHKSNCDSENYYEIIENKVCEV